MSALASPTSPTSPPALNMATKPTRSVSFMKHATVTNITDNTTSGNTTVVLTGAPGNVNRSSFRPGRRPGYVRKGPVQSDSDADSDSEDIVEEDEDEEDEKANGGIRNGIGAFSPKPVAGTSATVSGVVRPGQNYVRRAPVNSDTESDDDEPAMRSATVAPVSTSTPIAALNHTSNSTEEEEDSDTDNEDKKSGGGVGGLVKSMAQTRIAGPGQNYVRKAPVNSDSEDDDDDDKQHKPAARSTPAVNSPAPQQQQPPHSGGSIHNRHLNTVLGTAGLGGSSAPHSRTSSYDPYAAATVGIVGGLGVGGMPSPLSSPRSGPVATSPYNAYTPPPATNLGMAINNTSNSSLGNLSNNSSNPYLAASATSASSQIATSNLATSMAIYQQQQQEMVMIMQQQQIQIATMQQQQQAYQLLVYQQQQQHQQQLQAVHQHHSRAASANGSVHNLDTNTNTNKVNTSDSDDDVPLGEKQNHLPQLPSLPQFSSLMGMGSSSSFTTPSSPTMAATTITPASPNTYSPHLSVQQSPLLQHNRQLSTSSVHSVVNNGGGAVYLHQPISSSPLNPATSNAPLTGSLLGGQQQVYNGGHSYSQTSSQPRLSDYIEEEQERLIREQHLQATAAALGGHAMTTPPTSFNGGTSLLTSSFPAGYRGSVASVVTLQQASGIDRGSMASLHSTGSNGSGGSGGSGGGGGGIGQHRPTGSRDSFIPQMGPTLIQQQQYLTQPHQFHLQQQQQQQQQFLPYQQPATLIHVEAKPPPPSAGLVGAISAMERDKKLAKAHGTNQLQFQHQQLQQQMMVNVEKERWLQEQRRSAWETGQFPQQQQQQQQFGQQGQFLQQGVMPGQGQQMYYQQQPMMMMQVPMQQQPGWTSADEDEDERPLGAAH